MFLIDSDDDQAKYSATVLHTATVLTKTLPPFWSLVFDLRFMIMYLITSVATTVLLIDYCKTRNPVSVCHFPDMATAVCAQALASCVGCVALMEKLKWTVGEAANLVTLLGIIFMISEGLVSGHLDLTRRTVPLRVYLGLVLIYFLSNSANNLALLCTVPYPVFIVFRSASLPANVLVSFMLRRHMYPLRQVAAVCAISIGVFLFTLGSWRADLRGGNVDAIVERVIVVGPFEVDGFAVGVGFLVVSLFLSAYLGLKQEELYRDYGRGCARESMYYINLLTLPFMLLHGADVTRAAARASRAPHAVLPLPGGGEIETPLPWPWLVLAAITLLQYGCLSSVFSLSSLTSSLTTTLVLTIRKFLSLALSIYLFGNPLTAHHILGGILVLGGSLVYSPAIW